MASVFRFAARRGVRRRARAGHPVVHRARQAPQGRRRDGRRVDDAQAGARAAAHQQVPHARDVPRGPRSAASGRSSRYIADLDLATYGFTAADLDTEFDVGSFKAGTDRMRLADLIAALEETYCRTLGAEYMYISDTPTKRFVQERLEPIRSRPDISGRAAAAHPGAADRGGNAGALPAHEVRRAEALFRRRRAHDDSDARSPDPARRRARRAGDRDRHGAPRASQRARQHAGQDARGSLLRIRRQARAGVQRGRREVSPGLFVRRRHARRSDAPDARVQSVAPRER